MTKWLTPLIAVAPFIQGFWLADPYWGNYLAYGTFLLAMFMAGLFAGIVFEKAK